MADPEEHPERRKKTIYLLAGGAVSLLLPALGAVYLMNSGAGANAPSGRNDLFQRRDAGDKRLTPSQAAVPVAALAEPSSLPTPGGPAQAAGSSLDFIKPGAEMSSKFGDAPKPATAAATTPAAAPPPAAVPPPPAPAQAKTPAKKGKKEFVMPKLQPTRGFSSMGGHGAGAGTKGAAPAGAPAGAQGGSDVSEMLKNLPPDAASNPQLQQYLQQQQKGK